MKIWKKSDSGNSSWFSVGYKEVRKYKLGTADKKLGDWNAADFKNFFRFKFERREGGYSYGPVSIKELSLLKRLIADYGCVKLYQMICFIFSEEFKVKNPTISVLHSFRHTILTGLQKRLEIEKKKDKIINTDIANDKE